LVESVESKATQGAQTQAEIEAQLNSRRDTLETLADIEPETIDSKVILKTDTVTETKAAVEERQSNPSETILSVDKKQQAPAEVPAASHFTPLPDETPYCFHQRVARSATREQIALFIGKQYVLFLKFFTDFKFTRGIFWDDYREYFFGTFHFQNLPLDSALRHVSNCMTLPPEAQQVDRVMKAIGHRYHQCNPNVFKDGETVYIMCFAILMLNTALHNKNFRAAKQVSKRIFHQQLQDKSLLEPIDTRVITVRSLSL
jgi:hypothetical protein